MIVCQRADSGAPRLEHSLVHVPIVRPRSRNSELIPVVTKSHVVAQFVGEYQASTIVDREAKPERLVTQRAESPRLK